MDNFGKSLAVPMKKALLVLSLMTGLTVTEKDLIEIIPEIGSDEVTPLQIRVAHAALRKDRESLLDKLVTNGNYKLPPRIVCHFTKGGVGKTTLLANVAVELASMGFRVLFIDADPQGTSTSLFGVDVDDDSIRTLYDILFTHDGVPTSVERAVISLYNDAVLDLIPSDLRMSGFDMTATPRPKREFLVDKLLNTRADYFSNYDLILVDTNPGSNLLNQNLMIAADNILIPVALDILSTKSMKLMVNELVEVQDISDRERPLMIVGNMYQHGTLHSKASWENLQRQYPEQLLSTRIPTYAGFKRQGWGEASDPQLLIETEPTSPAAKLLTELALEVAVRAMPEMKIAA